MTDNSTIDRLVCGCPKGDNHTPTCVLGRAEEAALAAVAAAEDDGAHPLILALIGVANAGLLAPMDVNSDDGTATLMGILDQLYLDNLLVDPQLVAPEEVP
jgi:hypothetical protein